MTRSPVALLPRARALAGTAAQVVATAVLCTLSGLVLWSVLPTAVGWRTSAIVSGSMAPHLAVGDVVITSPVAVDALRPGMVVRFPDPTGAPRAIVHRVVRADAGGTLVTKGDANQSEDSTPVQRDAVTGVGRLRVPLVGLPTVWVREGRFAPVAAVTGLLALSTALALPRGAHPRARRQL
ncbi:signal peptidase I [Kineococcus glutinatus]|uniref:Signal peptidase I n=1 Tax=Kineococcus glutinatus TaxID=1070872 RepID=A0ABP9I0L4_9ACTN